MRQIKADTLAWLVLPLSALMSGCGTSGTTYYHTLSPTVSAGASHYTSAIPIAVAAVHVPAQLNRAELMWEASPGVFEVREFDHWAAPMSELARATLIEDLSLRLQPAAVVSAHGQQPKIFCEVALDVSSFRMTADGGFLAGNFSVREVGDMVHPTSDRSFDLHTHVGANESCRDSRRAEFSAGNGSRRSCGLCEHERRVQ